MWKNIQPAPADAILGLTEAFKKDENPKKINLGVGVYKDESGNTPVLQSIKAAEKQLVEKQQTKSYLPISGDPKYAQQVQSLLFGVESESIFQRARTVHTPGGTGALRIGADLLKKFNPEATVWVSSPTWANHKGIFTAARFEIKEYAYYNPATRALDFTALCETLKAVPAGDIVLLHVCCHNPTGVDPSQEEWKTIVRIAQEKGWIPFLDFAYQGFGDSVEADRFPLSLFAGAGIDFLVASSFSKNLGLYNERTGALTLVAPSKEEADVAFTHLKKTIRVNYSNPPAHGGLAAATVLADETLHAEWLKELAAMRDRIKAMRNALVDGLAARGVEQDFSFIRDQRGMFSFSGLSPEAVLWLKENRSIYIVGSGRINVAGLTPSNIDFICDAIAEVLKK